MGYPEYDSPLRLFIDETATQIAQQLDEECHNALVKAIQRFHIDVDESTLVEAIKQDEWRYREAYRRGYASRDEEIVRCKDCKHKNVGNWCDAHMEHFKDDDWFCADGEQAE